MLPSRLPPALLEDWMRDYYFETRIDIGSSGVEDYSMAELRRLLGISLEDLDRVVFHDSRTLGGPALRQAVAERWGGGAVERAIVTHGATEANFLVMTALLERGDEVVILDPLYQQLYSIAESLGCLLHRWPLRFEHGFVPDLDDARRLIGPRTRMVVVNFPHNPTGATLTLPEQRELIEICSRAGAYLVWDMAFGDLTYEEPPLPDPGLFYERAVSMGTLSKAYGLPGLRVGWCLAAPEVLERFIRIRDYLTLHLSPLVELIAQRAIENGDLLLEPRRRQGHRNREVVKGWIEGQGGRVEWVPPAGGVCAFPRLDGISDVVAFCRRLAQVEKVLLVPGECFGSPQNVRLGFGGSTGDLEEGLRRLSRALAGEPGD
ncbi:MAG TPA: capreomycidine synthase [Thermoanaerobaculia bacterium]|nr:capreomycidine synthase [Thermoanaerobaculia bacterium]